MNRPHSVITPSRAPQSLASPNRAQRRAIRFKRVLEIVPLGRARLYELIADPDSGFPKQFKLVKGGHAAAFWEDEIVNWLETRAATSTGRTK
jgi:predicted DNA-binding transcriptional regulator AlpA